MFVSTQLRSIITSQRIELESPGCAGFRDDTETDILRDVRGWFDLIVALAISHP